MLSEKVVSQLLKSFDERYKHEVSANALEQLHNDATAMLLAVATMFAENTPDEVIQIRINRQKVDPEMLIQMSDDWTDYCVGQLGIEPRDALMITPF